MTLRDDLRALKVFTIDTQTFDTDATPDDPMVLFSEWLAAAIAADVSAPHAMVLATAGADGIPSARTLLLKDVTPDGFWFASMSNSPKGRDLAENEHCALVLYWREQGRQVRITGTATIGPRTASESDFLARHPSARAAAIAGPQSEPMTEIDAAMTVASATIANDESYVPDEWNAYLVAPDMVEFWQTGSDRKQVRLRYDRGVDNWSSALIWP
jgi:pyridoxamine 5'-phosphate oxidase